MEKHNNIFQKIEPKNNSGSISQIKNLIDMLNETTVSKPDSVDLECQRELQEELINEVFKTYFLDIGRFNESNEIDKILNCLKVPSEYLKSELLTISKQIEEKRLGFYHKLTPNPTLFNN